MKITDIEAFQVGWAPDDRPQQRSAFVRVHTDDGLSGIGEASPMQGGVASLGIVARDVAPTLIGQDPLDHAVLLDRAFHSFVKLGPEGALTGALAALDIALWDLKGKLLGQPIFSSCSAAPGAPACRSTPRSAATGCAASMRCCASSKRASRTTRPRSRSASTTTAPGSTATYPATSPRRAPCASWSATASRSPSTQ
jgi:Mandelate racemase / muconate lactonizing enzyme, N-terminal domain